MFFKFTYLSCQLIARTLVYVSCVFVRSSHIVITIRYNIECAGIM